MQKFSFSGITKILRLLPSYSPYFNLSFQKIFWKDASRQKISFYLEKISYFYVPILETIQSKRFFLDFSAALSEQIPGSGQLIAVDVVDGSTRIIRSCRLRRRTCRDLRSTGRP